MENVSGYEDINSVLNNFTNKMKNMNGGSSHDKEKKETAIGCNHTKPVSYASVINNGPLKSHSFVTALGSEQPRKKLIFVLFEVLRRWRMDFVLPLESIAEVKNKFSNSLVGFFVDKRVAFPLVENYVRNTWAKFGFQKLMRDDEGFFYFKFTSITGLEQVLEQGPWLIRNTPLILNKWSPDLPLCKDSVTKVPIWVKVHKVPVIAYSEDGLSLIATQIGKPLMLDAFTSSMCGDTWGHIGYARTLIVISADKQLKHEVMIGVPLEDGTGHKVERMLVEYEWKPPLCLDCHIFYHSTSQCPKRVKEKTMEASEDLLDGFTFIANKRKKAKAKKATTNAARSYEGLKIYKPKASFVFGKKKQVGKPAEKNNENNEVGPSKKLNLKNSFNALQLEEAVEGNEHNIPAGVGSVDKQANWVDSDSEEVDEEVVLETPPIGFKGASTPSLNVPDV